MAGRGMQRGLVVATVFLLVLASQWAASHAGRHLAAPNTPDRATVDSARTARSVKQRKLAYDYSRDSDASWDAFSSEDASFAAKQEVQGTGDDVEDVFVDSPEVVHFDPNADDVFFDTSSADTIYSAAATDSGLSFAQYNITSEQPDAVLETMAKALGGCGSGNPIDDCWRCDPNWKSHRQALASCAVGFGRNAVGGKNGPIYVVTSNADDPQNPAPGTLRYGVTREGPLWITFAKSMTVQLKAELWISSFKTLDGRGAEVHITTQVTIKQANNVILHGLYIHDVKTSSGATIRVSPSKVVKKGKAEGDAIHIWGSHDVWVDHVYLARATDGLCDVTKGSTDVTVSNSYFEKHNKVMLLGASPSDTQDRNMRVTVAFNKFGPGLTQRLPRVRFGVVHVLNNDYSSGWGSYAIGGSEAPTILSQGNYFKSSKEKEVTQRISDGGDTFGGWQKWNWGSDGDIFLNGAFFTGSGAKASSAGVYAKAYSATSRPAKLVPAITNSAGPLK